MKHFQLSGCGTCCCTKPTTRCHQMASSGQVACHNCTPVATHIGFNMHPHKHPTSMVQVNAADSGRNPSQRTPVRAAACTQAACPSLKVFLAHLQCSLAAVPLQSL